MRVIQGLPWLLIPDVALAVGSAKTGKRVPVHTVKEFKQHLCTAFLKKKTVCLLSCKSHTTSLVQSFADPIWQSQS